MRAISQFGCDDRFDGHMSMIDDEELFARCICKERIRRQTDGTTVTARRPVVALAFQSVDTVSPQASRLVFWITCVRRLLVDKKILDLRVGCEYNSLQFDDEDFVFVFLDFDITGNNGDANINGPESVVDIELVDFDSE